MSDMFCELLFFKEFEGFLILEILECFEIGMFVVKMCFLCVCQSFCEGWDVLQVVVS